MRPVSWTAPEHICDKTADVRVVIDALLVISVTHQPWICIFDVDID